jgi:hypothetical protein
MRAWGSIEVQSQTLSSVGNKPIPGGLMAVRRFLTCYTGRGGFDMKSKISILHFTHLSGRPFVVSACGSLSDASGKEPIVRYWEA